MGKGKDFGFRATEETRGAAETQEREYLKQKAHDLVGRTFQNQDQTLVVTVDDSGVLIEVRNGQRGQGRSAGLLWRPLRQAACVAPKGPCG